MDQKLIEEAYMEILLNESPDSPPIWRMPNFEGNEIKRPFHKKRWNDYDAISFGSVLGVYFCAYSHELFASEGFIKKTVGFRDNMTHYNMIKVLLSVFGTDMDWNNMSWKDVENLIRERFKIRFDIISTSNDKPVNVYSHIHLVTLKHISDEQRENLENVNVDRTKFFHLCGRLWTTPYPESEDYIISFWNEQEKVDEELGEIEKLLNFYDMDPSKTHIEYIDDDAEFVEDTKTITQTGSSLGDSDGGTKKRSKEEIEKALGAEHVMDPIEKKQRGIKVPEGVGSRKSGPDLKTRQMAMTSEGRIPSFKEYVQI